MFLCLLLCLVNFSVVANAASSAASSEEENLVDNNLSNWVDYGKDEPTLFQSASVTYLGNNTNYISVSGSKKSVILFDVTEFLKIGESYQFSFSLPKTEGLNNTALNSCKLTWFLCDGSGDVYPAIGNNVFEITIDSSNKDKYLGQTTSFEFTYTQGFKNTYLCFAISPADNVESYNYLQLYIANVKLERIISESEKKLDGILGWLEELWNTISGLPQKIGESIKGIFVPPEGFFDSWKNQFSLMLKDNLGFIYQVPDLIIAIFENIRDIVNTNKEFNLSFPKVEFDLLGTHYVLFQETKVDISFLRSDIWSTLYSMYKVMLHVMFSFALIKFGKTTLERTLEN